jgi:hypothetical protein
MSGNVLAASRPPAPRPPPFGSIRYAQQHGRSAWAYASTDSKLKAKFQWADPPLGTRLPKNDREWERLSPKEIREKSGTFMSRVMFKRECVLYCSKKRAFYMFFSCRHPTCDRQGAFYFIKNGHGYRNLEDHAERCFGNTYKETLANAEKSMRNKNDGASVLIDTTFLPLVRETQQCSNCLN